MNPKITITVLNPVCSIHGTAYHNGRCGLCDKLEGIDTVIQPPTTSAEREIDMKPMIVTPFKAKNGKWYFNGKAGNHEIQLPSQGYASRRGAIRGFKALQRNIVNAVIKEL